MKPSFNVTVNGSDITGTIADRLLSLTITDEAGVKSDRVEITLDDRDQRLSVPPTKATITVAIGYPELMVNKGTYLVEEVELEGPERKMMIRANATGASKGAGASKERSWNSTTLGDIARSIAGKHGWTATISPTVDKLTVSHASQNESDTQFLARLAAENGAVAKVTHGRLVVAPHGEGKSVSGKSLPVITVNAGDATDWNWTSAERGNYDGVKAKYHDLKSGKRGESIAGSDGENTHTLTHTYASSAEADRAAKSKHSSLKRGKSKFSIRNMPGNPAIEAESRLNASGFRAGVDGQWTVNKVVHTLTGESYTCSIECESPM